MEVDLILKHFHLFVEIVRQTALPAKEQISSLKGFVINDFFKKMKLKVK